MGYSMMFWYMCTLCNRQIRWNTSTFSNIHHFYVVKTFKILLLACLKYIVHYRYASLFYCISSFKDLWKSAVRAETSGDLVKMQTSVQQSWGGLSFCIFERVTSALPDADHILNSKTSLLAPHQFSIGTLMGKQNMGSFFEKTFS